MVLRPDHILASTDITGRNIQGEKGNEYLHFGSYIRKLIVDYFWDEIKNISVCQTENDKYMKLHFIHNQHHTVLLTDRKDWVDFFGRRGSFPQWKQLKVVYVYICRKGTLLIKELKLIWLCENEKSKQNLWKTIFSVKFANIIKNVIILNTFKQWINTCIQCVFEYFSG